MKKWEEVQNFCFKMCWQAAKKYRVEAGDLFSASWMGYEKAAGSWKPEKGPFMAWLKLKVRGAIIDELRAMKTPGTRLSRKTVRKDTVFLSDLPELMLTVEENQEPDYQPSLFDLREYCGKKADQI